MRKRQTVSKALATADIEKLSHDGRGIAYLDGKITFIQGALAKETVSFQYLRKKRDYDEGVARSIEKSSPQRVEATCAHYEKCGGCSLQHISEAEQIHIKQDLLVDLLRRVGHVEAENLLKPLKGPTWHYRNKARLSVRYVEKKSGVLVGFREKNNGRYIADIEQCAILNARVDAQIMSLRHLIESLDNPRDIAQIEVAAGDEEVALIFRNLSALTANDEVKIADFAKKTAFKIFLQPGNEDSVKLFFPPDAAEYLSYTLPNENLTFHFYPTDFTQVNSMLNQKMIAQAMDLLDLKKTDTVLDLFCGLGNFSLPMAKRAMHVVGIEGSEKMVQRARMNAQLNGLDNTEFHTANLTKTEILSTFKTQQFSHLLIDPPRTGAFEIVKEIDKIKPKRIVYVSCNPATLARDADVLVNQHGYHLKSAGVMDMFPHTAHVESIACFEIIK